MHTSCIYLYALFRSVYLTILQSCSKKSLLHHWEPLPLSNTFSLTLQAVRVLPMGNNNINEMTINHIAMTDQHMQPS